MLSLKRSGPWLVLGGRRVFLIGVNYWSRKHNIKMWRRWDPEGVSEDLDKMKALGINAARVFLLAEDFATADGALVGECAEKLSFLLDEAAKRGIAVFPSLIVGHMSGKNWPIPWDPNNEIYTPRVVERTKRFFREVVGEFKDHSAVGGWIISNEITNVRRASSLEEFRVWLSEIAGAIRGVDGERALSLGDNVSPAAHLELKPENVVDLIDYLTPHIYRYDSDPVRHTLEYAAIVEYCRSFGRPVVVEEFGYPTNLYSEESRSGFIEVVLHLAFLHGASGAFIWCFSDFPREEDEPYLWEPHELSFGLLRADGSEKPAASVVREFARRLRESGAEELEVPAREAAIVVPAYMYRDYPFHNLPREAEWKFAVQAFALAKAASLSITFAREPQLGSYKLLLLPSVSRLLTTTWRRLLGTVEEGAVLYYSPVRHTDWPHMSACHVWEELFGVRPTLPAGSPGKRLVLGATLRFTRDLPPVESGFTLSVPGSEKVMGYEFEAVDAEVLAVDESDKPCIFLAKRGRGAAVLSAVPLEALLALQPTVDWDAGYHRLYEALARLAGLKAPFRSTNPRVQVEYLEGRGRYLVGVINHSYSPVDCVVEHKGGLNLADAWGTKIVKMDGRVAVGLKPKSAALILFEERG